MVNASPISAILPSAVRVPGQGPPPGKRSARQAIVLAYQNDPKDKKSPKTCARENVTTRPVSGPNPGRFEPPLPVHPHGSGAGRRRSGAGRPPQRHAVRSEPAANLWGRLAFTAGSHWRSIGGASCRAKITTPRPIPRASGSPLHSSRLHGVACTSAPCTGNGLVSRVQVRQDRGRDAAAARLVRSWRRCGRGVARGGCRRSASVIRTASSIQPLKASRSVMQCRTNQRRRSRAVGSSSRSAPPPDAAPGNDISAGTLAGSSIPANAGAESAEVRKVNDDRHLRAIASAESSAGSAEVRKGGALRSSAVIRGKPGRPAAESPVHTESGALLSLRERAALTNAPSPGVFALVRLRGHSAARRAPRRSPPRGPAVSYRLGTGRPAAPCESLRLPPLGQRLGQHGHATRQAGRLRRLRTAGIAVGALGGRSVIVTAHGQPRRRPAPAHHAPGRPALKVTREPPHLKPEDRPRTVRRVALNFEGIGQRRRLDTPLAPGRGRPLRASR